MVEQCMAYGLIWVSPGELADRLSILEIKHEKGLCGPEEVQELQGQWEQIGVGRSYVDELKRINLEAWDYVQKIYEYFDECKWPDADIAATCRIAHKLNKKRVTLKNKINEALGVNHKEVKTWK